MKLLLLGIGMQEIIFLAIIALLFFGGKKIPELMKGVGKGVRSFKEGLNEKDEDEVRNEAATTDDKKA